MEVMEDIDDDCDVHGVHFVKISDPAAAYQHGISSLPTLVYFKNKVPNVYDGKHSTIVDYLRSVAAIFCRNKKYLFSLKNVFQET